MQNLFYPESVVVFGVSTAPANMGKVIVGNLDSFGFKGAVYLVGHEGGHLNGREIYQRVEDVDADPDLAVFLIPARFIPEALNACGKKGIRYAVIESAGFNEYGEEGNELDKELLDVAKKWNIRFVGPNCLGLINLENGLTLPFAPLDPTSTKRGHVSLAAQSGGVVVDSIRLFSLENIGFDKMVSIGNKLDLDENDYLNYLISDPSTRTIGLYLENISDGRRLMNLASQTDKPVIILKANTNASSNQIAQFHTASLAGDDQVVDAAFRQAGLIRVQNMQEMMDCFKTFSLPLIKGPKLGILCRSGGQAVMLADSAHRHGFKLAEFSSSFYDYVKQKVRAGVIQMTNPLDLGDVLDVEIHIEVMEKAIQEKDVDGLVVNHVYIANFELPPTRRFIEAAQRISLQYDKPVIFCVLSEKDDWFSLKQVADFPIFSESDYALKSLRSSYDHFMNRSGISKSKQQFPPLKDRATVETTRSSEMMNPSMAFDMLKSYRIPVVDYRSVKTAEEGQRAAEEIGYPVVLKIASPNILHKTEAKGVRLNIGSAGELEAAFKEMEGEEFLIQKMAPAGQEVIIGGKKDPEFGPVILFGLGGVFVEVLKDVALRVAPVDEKEAEKMIGEIKGAQLLKGFRGKPPADKEALIKCLVNVSRLLIDNPEIKNLDINPLIIWEKGKGCLAVDAKIEKNFSHQ